MELKVNQKELPTLFVADTPVNKDWIRIISGTQIRFIERESIPDLIDALNKLK